MAQINDGQYWAIIWTITDSNHHLDTQYIRLYQQF